MKIFTLAVAIALLISTVPSSTLASQAADMSKGPEGNIDGAAALLDLAIVRPISLAASLVGIGTFIISLPFTIPSSSVASAGRSLVKVPLAYTFTRPLGETCSPHRQPR